MKSWTADGDDATGGRGEMSYECTVALITGGGSGMGQLVCQNMAKAGVKVAALDINEAGLTATAEGQSNITTYVCDVADFGAVDIAVKSIEADIGAIDRQPSPCITRSSTTKILIAAFDLSACTRR